MAKMRVQRFGHDFLRVYCVLLLTLPDVAVLASKNSSDPQSSLSSIAPRASTCPYGTVNYITHSLPQQCLTTSWGGQIPSSIPSPETLSASTSLDNANTSYALPSTETSRSVAQPASASPIQPLPALQSSSQNAYEPTSTHAATSPSKNEEGTNSAVEREQETDTESFLDNARFLSFEDWKQQALVKAEQAAEKMESIRTSGNEPRRRPGGINNALDSLGEDGEIELDFAGFVPDNAEPTAWGRQVVDTSSRATSQDDPDAGQGKIPRAQGRSNDAGTTCKERFNYASFDCAANVLKHNPECSGSSSVLVENKDSYMLNVCASKNKFFIVELCNDILVDTIVLANFEFFSSIFRTFRVSVSDRYPIKLDKWQVLGTFAARNTREVQAFLIENPLIWARYLRIEFLTHYGNEYYCPVSLLRVHGTTPYEELKIEGDSPRVDDEVDQDSAESEANGERLKPEAVADPIAEELKTALENIAKVSHIETQSPTATADETVSVSTSSATMHKTIDPDDSICAVDEQAEEVVFVSAFNASRATCAPDESALATKPIQRTSTPTATKTSSSQSASPVLSADPSLSNASTMTSLSSSTNKPNSSASSLSSSSKSINQTASASVKTASSSTQPHPANPTTQESFLKSIHKRLQMLETNSTLSLLYIEEQSRNLRDAFSKVEKRQLSKTTTFLENLNTTVLSELRDFRQQYDQIWQSTVIELGNQRESYRREVLAITARLSVLADEVVFQKRMSIVQSILILICLALVLFTKGSAANYLELPLMQNMLQRSQSSFFRSSSPTFGTPSGSPTSTRPNSSYKEKRPFKVFRRHTRGASDESRDGALSPTIHYSPPTPTSDTGPSGSGGEDEDQQTSRVPSPPPGIDPTIRPMSSPPNLGAAKLNAVPSTWAGSESPLSQVLTPLEPIETPPRGPIFERGDGLERSTNFLRTHPDG